MLIRLCINTGWSILLVVPIAWNWNFAWDVLNMKRANNKMKNIMITSFFYEIWKFCFKCENDNLKIIKEQFLRGNLS